LNSSSTKILKNLIRLLLVEMKSSKINQPFELDLLDDPAISQPSVLVPDEVKSAIKKWSKEMHLSKKKAKKDAL